MTNFKSASFLVRKPQFLSKKRKNFEKEKGEEGDKKSKLDESFTEDIDNPFLRPVKMPRFVKTPK